MVVSPFYSLTATCLFRVMNYEREVSMVERGLLSWKIFGTNLIQFPLLDISLQPSLFSEWSSEHLQTKEIKIIEKKYPNLIVIFFSWVRRKHLRYLVIIAFNFPLISMLFFRLSYLLSLSRDAWPWHSCWLNRTSQPLLSTVPCSRRRDSAVTSSSRTSRRCVGCAWFLEGTS